MRSRGAFGPALFLAALAALAPVFAEEVGATSDPRSAILSAAREDIAALRFEEALAAIGDVLGSPQLPEPLRLEAHVLRAEAHGAAGDLDAVGEDYRQILLLSPAFLPDPNRTSRKAMARFEQASAQTIGTIRARLEPPDAIVRIDGRVAARSARGVFPALPGVRALRVERKGFDSDERNVDIVAGRETPVEIRLVPNARTVVLRTEPDGVLVNVDGREAGVTVRPTLPDGSPLASQAAEMRLEDLPLGEHTFTLAKPCYRTIARQELLAVDLMDRSPLVSEVVTMVPVSATLSVRGIDSGAEIWVDGGPQGTVPREAIRVCPGPRTVEVRAQGRIVWRGTMELGEGESRTLEVHARPNLVLAGAGAVPERLEPLVATMSLLGSVGLPDMNDPSEAATWKGVALPPNTDAVLVLEPATGLRAARSYLYSPILRIVEPLENLDFPPDRPEWSRAAFGFRVADSDVGGPARVVEVAPGGAAAAAAIQVGDRVLAVGSEKVSSSSGVVLALRRQRPGAQVEVELEGSDSAPRTVRLTGTSSPVVGDVGGGRPETILAAWAASGGAAGGDAASPALANLALLLARRERHEEAVAVWGRVGFGNRRGIGAGTVDYHVSRSLDALGREGDAREALLRARASTATSGDDEGLEVAPAAADRLADLGLASGGGVPR